MYVVPVGGSLTSKDLPEEPVHSMEPSCGTGSPEIETVTRGGHNFGSSPLLTTSVHHELPIIIAVGGGHKKLWQNY